MARRLSYKIKSRGGRHVVPLTLLGVVLICLVFFSGSSSHSSALASDGFGGSRSQRLGRGLTSLLGSRSRPEPPAAPKPKVKNPRPGKERNNGLSLLVQEEEELIAEDDLFWDQYEEELPRTEAQRAADADMLAHKEDVAERNKKGSLRALVWWLAEGGVIPSDWKVPSASYIRKIGARGMERMLEDIEPGYPDEPIFEDGWAEYANKRYRVVIFSKSYCPYSARAKGIVSEHHLSPAPYIIELDHRDDTAAIQSILEHLTGRRTVPNILFDYVSIGGSDDLTLMQSEGSLKRKFDEMELTPGSRKRPIWATGADVFVDPPRDAAALGVDSIQPPILPGEGATDADQADEDSKTTQTDKDEAPIRTDPEVRKLEQRDLFIEQLSSVTENEVQAVAAPVNHVGPETTVSTSDDEDEEKDEDAQAAEESERVAPVQNKMQKLRDRAKAAMEEKRQRQALQKKEAAEIAQTGAAPAEPEPKMDREIMLQPKARAGQKGRQAKNLVKPKKRKAKVLA